MSQEKVLTKPIDPAAGLNLSHNPLLVRPGQMIGGENFVVALPQYAQTQAPTKFHVLQTQPPIAISYKTAFDLAVGNGGNIVQPLVGKTQDPSDTKPAQWATLGLCYRTSEGNWAGSNTNGGTAFKAKDVSGGLTQSDGNDNRLQCYFDNGSGGYATAIVWNNNPTLCTVTSPPLAHFVGQPLGNRTELWIDYKQRYGGRLETSLGSGVYHDFWCETLKMRIGVDSSNYLEYTLPVQTGVKQATAAFFQNRYKVDLRSFDSLTGSLTFPQIMANIAYIQFRATLPAQLIQNNSYPVTTNNMDILFEVDHVRLNPMYEDFFGEFTVQQPYQQRTICNFENGNGNYLSEVWDLTSITDGLIYFDRRLSEGDRSLCFELDPSGTGQAILGSSNILPLSFSSKWPAANLGLLDLRVENLTYLSGITVTLESSPGNNRVWNLTGIVEGNQVVKLSRTPDSTNGSPTDTITRILIDVTAAAFTPGTDELAMLRVYLDNFRTGPYTTGTGFTALSGNIRDLSIYESKDDQTHDNFVWACGDGLFIGGDNLSPTSFFVGGGFGNWDPDNGIVFQKPWVAVPVANPNYFDSDGDPQFGQPKNLQMLVNGVDGLFALGIIQYELADGTIYPYPTLTRVRTRAYSTMEVFAGRLFCAGDPNNPNQLDPSGVNDPLTFTSTDEFPLDLQGTGTIAGDHITMLKRFEGFLLIHRKTGIEVFSGDSPSNFRSTPSSADRGAAGPRHCVIGDRHVYFMGYDGVYEFAGLKATNISTEIDAAFELQDAQKILSGYLAYNPVREVLLAVIMHRYTVDPVTVGGGETYCAERYFYSLAKSAWTRMRVADSLDLRYLPFSAVYFGGETSGPVFYESSLSLLTWDVTGDNDNFVADAQWAPMHFGSPRQLKTFDGITVYGWGTPLIYDNFFNLQRGRFELWYDIGLAANNFTMFAEAINPDGDGFIEELFPSGLISRQIAARLVVSTVSPWPYEVRSLQLTYWNGEDV